MLLIVGITGALGVIYGIRLLEVLATNNRLRPRFRDGDRDRAEPGGIHEVCRKDCLPGEVIQCPARTFSQDDTLHGRLR